VLLVTHDRYFLDQVATTILAFAPGEAGGTIVPFASFGQWETWRAGQLKSARAAGRRGADAPAPRRKLSYLEQREYEAIEETIARAEAALATATADSERPEHASDAAKLIELLAAVSARQEEIERLYARWAELEAKLAGPTDP
jgi:ATP-binding cassette subfamily F protein uup